MPKVLNKRTDFIPPDAILVDRTTKWGNLFKVSQYGRAGSLLRYADWLDKHPEVVEMAKIELVGKDLVCWCAPLPCHADILLELANK